MEERNPMEKLREFFRQLPDQNIIQITLSNTRDAARASKVKVRPVSIRGRVCFQETLYLGKQVFHRNLEKLEIYNGNLDRESFEAVVLERFGKWDGERQIFECSIFQNIIENQILYLGMEDEEILAFYRKVKKTLEGRPYKILYLDVEDIAGAIDVIRRERSDDAGNELWFPLMLRYLEESPYGQEHGLSGLKGLLMHLAHRKNLERRIIEEVCREQTVVIRAKDYQVEEIIKC